MKQTHPCLGQVQVFGQHMKRYSLDAKELSIPRSMTCCVTGCYAPSVQRRLAGQGWGLAA